MNAHPSPRPEEVLVSGRFRIVRKLGAGTMGSVYLARDELTNREVAFKVIRADLLGPEGVQELQAEFRALAGLSHPRIAAAFDFGYLKDGGLPFYTREFIEGSPLRAGPPGRGEGDSPREYLRPVLDLLDALHYLHAQEILHLDIHPGNLIEASDPARGSVLIDFGVLNAFRDRRPSSLLARRSSLPPEFLGDEPLGPAADVFGAGRLLLYRLTGSAEGDARLPREIPGWGTRLTLSLERVITKAIQADPRQRFSSVAAFREALSDIVGISRGAPSFTEPGEVTVGREPELAAIEEGLRRAAGGSCATLWLTGPPGVGKSRLLTEARWSAQLRGLSVVNVRFFHPPVGRPQLLEALGAYRGASARWLEPLAAEHGGSSLDRALRAARAYFDAGGPSMAIILDDFEHADRESRLLAEALLVECGKRGEEGRPGRGLAIIVASASPPRRDQNALRGPVAVRRLKPLSGIASRDLLTRLVRPLRVGPSLISQVARESKGLPLRLRRAAGTLHTRWGAAGEVPGEADLSPIDSRRITRALPSPGDRAPALVLRALAALERPARLEEIEVATGLARDEVKRALRGLLADETLVERLRGRSRLFAFAQAAMAAEMRGRIKRPERLQVHARVLDLFRRIPNPDPSCLESLARHLLIAGRPVEARKAALKTADLLRRRGLLDAAVRLLRAAESQEKQRPWRLRFVEEISSIHEEAGDHAEGIEVLEPVLRGELGSLQLRDAIRLRRRMGVHCHRAGDIERALAHFREVIDLGDLTADAEELILVESELAEIHTLRGDYREAEAACRRGLGLLERSGRLGREFERRMQMVLRGSMGHLELRRMALDRAVIELKAASALARSSGTTAIQALLLNNLGIALNQSNDLAGARRCYVRAKRLHFRSGERREVILLSANLATIDAKTGNSDAAREHLKEAVELAGRYPGKRTEFMVELARGLVAYFTGDLVAARDRFRQALPLGRDLGDLQSLLHADVYLSETELACGQPGSALRRLRAADAGARTAPSPVFRRMVHARLFFLENLLGRNDLAEGSLRVLESTPRSDGLLPETWNDLYQSWGHALSEGVDLARQLLEAASRRFHSLGIPTGRRLANVGLLYLALPGGENRRLQSLLKEIGGEAESAHGFLLVLEPLARAEAYLALGDLTATEAALRDAAGAIAGLPFLELDWRIELTRARLAERRGDREGARTSLHRSLNARDLLARSLPGRLRRRYLAHPRFRGLTDLSTRLERPRPTPVAQAGITGTFQGMIGRSPGMMKVFEMVERLRDQEIPVLISGETGTGKELVARAIHSTGPRHRGPFFALHCASLPAELFESELFGHEAGAFTGADRARPGLLESVSGGSLFLDEISSLSLATQSKLLRVLDSRVVRPLGGTDTRPVDVRFLASTSTDLRGLVAAGEFRGDLFYRIAGVEVSLPPLRCRREDIPDLANHFLASHACSMGIACPHLSAEAMGLLRDHAWRGNVRELEAVAVRLLLGGKEGATGEPGGGQGKYGTLGPEAVRKVLPDPAGEGLFSTDLVAGRDLDDLRDQLERVYLTHLFREVHGDLRRMMAVLEVTQATLYRWFRKLKIDLKALRDSL